MTKITGGGGRIKEVLYQILLNYRGVFLMKKLIALVATGILATSLVCAQISVGAKGTVDFNLGTTFGEKAKETAKTEAELYGAEVSYPVMVGGGGSIFAGYQLPMLPALGFRLELGILANNGITTKMKIGENEGKTTFSYTSLELPIITSYDVALGPVVLTPYLGPNFSIALGKQKTTQTKNDNKEELPETEFESPFSMGLVAGLEIGIPVGPGSVIADLRYINDFMELRPKNAPEGFGATRRALAISAGYKMTF